MLPNRGLVVIALSACSALAVLWGCGAKSQDFSAANGIMTVLGLEYGDYLASHRNAPPADLAEFRKFVESRPEKLSEYRVKVVDALFTSPRDEQAINVVCGVKQPMLDQAGYALAAYEAKGVDGKRLTSNSRGGVSELSSDDFARAFPGLSR
jgi:hypothetical protein